MRTAAQHRVARVVLYKMATGRRPFREQSSAALCAQILRDAPSPVTHVRAELPDELSRVVQRCLEKDPQRRAAQARCRPTNVFSNQLRTSSSPAPCGAGQAGLSHTNRPLENPGRFIAHFPYAMIQVTGIGTSRTKPATTPTEEH